ncbi:PDDEXK nuclease domain-containing protein [Telluribacter sp.]|jgi:predicted nuclease of restriction endonuclease-like (RecB) superfamily|uniref:PDDEXK nuclease domain-containing protein n=1 Tax=Telluribacter sp. TaxID=1978767 RepID=UPI002E144D04|nr:PDDEXK nuclease domain-containing protein [Telluribacter sp.]
MNLSDPDYKAWLRELKSKIRSVQLKAAVAVNSALIEFYWELGKMIDEKHTGYGNQFLDRLSKDLKAEFPEMKGLSYRNLAFCRQFYQFYSSSILQQPVAEFIQQAVGQIPWGHNILIFSKSADVNEANFYLNQTLENNWSRDVLALQIKSHLYERQGKAITNFRHTLPTPQSELAEQTLKDPYIFEFLTLAGPYKEKDIENQLVAHVTKFLLELGKGFAFLGQQYHLEVAGNDYYLDLLFYHTKLKCHVVIELKNTRFIPEYAGKLNRSGAPVLFVSSG